MNSTRLKMHHHKSELKTLPLQTHLGVTLLSLSPRLPWGPIWHRRKGTALVRRRRRCVRRIPHSLIRVHTGARPAERK